MISIPLFLTQEHPCSYLDSEIAQTLYVHPSFSISNQNYAELMKQGFRRSGNEVYAPHCVNCTACIPVRLDVAHFEHNRNHKRCLKKNINTRAIEKPASFSLEHYKMYLRYQAERHAEGSMENFEPEDYIKFLGSSWCNTRFVEFLINDELAAVAVVDQFENAWSAVYTFFEPKYSSFSLGKYAVLWEIEQAKLKKIEYLYLGYWIKKCKKMAYKNKYQPLQLLINNQWIDMSDLKNEDTV